MNELPHQEQDYCPGCDTRAILLPDGVCQECWNRHTAELAAAVAVNTKIESLKVRLSKTRLRYPGLVGRLSRLLRRIV